MAELGTPSGFGACNENAEEAQLTSNLDQDGKRKGFMNGRGFGHKDYLPGCVSVRNSDICTQRRE